jgi:hypothetical protein
MRVGFVFLFKCLSFESFILWLSLLVAILSDEGGTIVKTKLVAVILVVGLIFGLMPITVTQAQQTGVFQDNFESYSIGSFPSAGGWNLWFDGQGSQYQTIVSGTSISGTKVLKLWGRNGWAAVAAKPFIATGKIGFEARVKVENFGITDKVGATVGFAKQES